MTDPFSVFITCGEILLIAYTVRKLFCKKKRKQPMLYLRYCVVMIKQALLYFLQMSIGLLAYSSRWPSTSLLLYNYVCCTFKLLICNANMAFKWHVDVRKVEYFNKRIDTKVVFKKG